MPKTNHIKTLTLNIIVVALVLLTSCNNQEKKDSEVQNTQPTEDLTQPTKTETPSEAISFTDTKWKLVALMGQEVDNEKAFISFATEEHRVFGNNGCNNFTGTYTLKEGNRIVLSKIATTMMACMNVTIEDQFMKVLETADNYSLNGNKMTLNKAKMAPLAVFEAVE